MVLSISSPGDRWGLHVKTYKQIPGQVTNYPGQRTVLIVNTTFKFIKNVAVLPLIWKQIMQYKLKTMFKPKMLHILEVSIVMRSNDYFTILFVQYLDKKLLHLKRDTLHWAVAFHIHRRHKALLSFTVIIMPQNDNNTGELVFRRVNTFVHLSVYHMITHSAREKLNCSFQVF